MVALFTWWMAGALLRVSSLAQMNKLNCTKGCRHAIPCAPADATRLAVL